MIGKVIDTLDDLELEDLISKEVEKLPKEWNMAEDLGTIRPHLELAKSDIKSWSTNVSTLNSI